MHTYRLTNTTHYVNMDRVNHKKRKRVQELKLELTKLKLKNTKLKLKNTKLELKGVKQKLIELKERLNDEKADMITPYSPLEYTTPSPTTTHASPQAASPQAASPQVKDRPSFQSTFAETHIIRELAKYFDKDDLLALATTSTSMRSVFIPCFIKQKEWRLSRVQECSPSWLVHIENLFYDVPWWMGMSPIFQGVKHLRFGEEFEQPLKEDMLPAGLRSLLVCVTSQNAQHFSTSVYPVGLKELTIDLLSGPCSWNFKQSLGKLALPEGLEKITLKNSDPLDSNNALLVDYPVAYTLPANLKHVTFTGNFKQSWIADILPASVTNLDFDCLFNHVLAPGALPEALVTLEIGGFNQPLEVGVLPQGLQSLKLWGFNSPLVAGVLPPNLQVLELNGTFNQPLEVGVLPIGLKDLTVGHLFNQAFEPDALPASLLYLQVGSAFDHPLESVLPDNLLDLTCAFDYKHIPVVLPCGRRLWMIYSSTHHCLMYE